MTKGIAWPIGVIVVLAATVTTNMLLMYVAGHDASFAIEPNYYAKAVTWDSTLAAETRSRALGWTLTPMMRIEDGTHSSRLTLRLTDRSGAPIHGATLHVAALFVGDANDVSNATCTETAPGIYETTLPVRHLGLWELRVSATLGAAHFSHVARLEVRPTS